MKYSIKQSGRSILTALLLATLSACSWDEKEVTPEENEEITLPPPPTNAKYSGRVVDGYLRYATVWLDLNNNWIPDADEPITQTSAYGRFAFSEEDLAGIERPQDYPLVVYAYRDETVDEGLIRDGNEDSGRILASFFLAAPPGVKTITPLTTLVKLELDELQQDPELADAKKTLSQAHAQVRNDLGVGPEESLLHNYIAIQNVRFHAIARALIANLQWALQNLAPDVGPDPLTLLASEDFALLGKTLRDHAKALAEKVDDHLQQHFGDKPTMAQVAGMDLAPLIDTAVLAPLTNAQVLTEIAWYVHADTVSGNPSSFYWTTEPSLAPLQKVAQAHQSFNLLGQVTEVAVDGWLSVGIGPSLQQGIDYGLVIDFSQPISIPDTLDNFRLTHSFEAGRIKETQVQLLQDEFTAPPDLQALASAPIRYQYDASGRLSKAVMAAPDGERTLTYSYEKGALKEIREKVVTTTDDKPETVRQSLTRRQYNEDYSRILLSEYFVATADEDLDETTPVASVAYAYDAQGRMSRSCTSAPGTLSIRCWHYEYENGRLKYSYQEVLLADEEPKGHEGAVIVLLTYGYEPLKDVAR